MSKEVKWNRAHYKNGQLSEETPYVNGQRHGIEKWWYSDGQLMWETPFVHDQRHGTRKIWNRDGKLWSIEKWHRGQRVIRIEFDNVPSDAAMELDLITNEMSYE
jgi:antitoxin component YwqK of YwqJK toxin-antitoxin module